MNRNTLIKWSGMGVFALSALSIILSVSLGNAPATMLCISVAALGVLAIICEVLWMYVIVPPIKEYDDADDV